MRIELRIIRILLKIAQMEPALAFDREAEQDFKELANYLKKEMERNT